MSWLFLLILFWYRIMSTDEYFPTTEVQGWICKPLSLPGNLGRPRSQNRFTLRPQEGWVRIKSALNACNLRPASIPSILFFRHTFLKQPVLSLYCTSFSCLFLYFSNFFILNNLIICWFKFPALCGSLCKLVLKVMTPRMSRGWDNIITQGKANRKLN